MSVERSHENKSGLHIASLAPESSHTKESRGSAERSPDQQLTELMELLNLAINSRLMDRESKVLEVDRLAGLYKAAVAEWVSTEEDQ